MSNAIKVGIRYAHPFWREEQRSGTVIGHVGPVIELYDHSDVQEAHFSLMGFVNEGLRSASPIDRQARILDYLATHLGEKARDFLEYYEKDWSTDLHTSDGQLNSVYISPGYGHELLQSPQLSGRLMFASAEISEQHGGYMDGAIIRGRAAAEWALL